MTKTSASSDGFAGLSATGKGFIKHPTTGERVLLGALPPDAPDNKERRQALENCMKDTAFELANAMQAQVDAHNQKHPEHQHVPVVQTAKLSFVDAKGTPIREFEVDWARAQYDPEESKRLQKEAKALPDPVTLDNLAGMEFSLSYMLKRAPQHGQAFEHMSAARPSTLKVGQPSLQGRIADVASQMLNIPL